MNLESARNLIEACIDQANSVYGGILFDEWAVIFFINKKREMLAYWGNRESEFLNNFDKDIQLLSASIESGNYGYGDFDFERHAVGSKMDAFVVVGPATYLFCNNLSKCMDDITKDTKWLAAQSVFAELCDRFRHDPLESNYDFK